MLDIVLFQPKIPQNTGNIIRLSVNLGARLHLIRPMGFIWNEKWLKRAAMDYIEAAQITLWNDITEFCAQHTGNLYGIETGGAQTIYQNNFKNGDALIFGSEDDGLPEELQQQLTILTIPQAAGRSLNLSNAVAVTGYEFMRQVENW